MSPRLSSRSARALGVSFGRRPHIGLACGCLSYPCFGYVSPPDELDALIRPAVERSEAEIVRIDELAKTARAEPQEVAPRAKRGARKR